MRYIFSSIFLVINILTCHAQLLDDNRVRDLTLDSLNKANTARPVSGSTRKRNNPVLFLVGNSTMRTGTLGNGNNGQWGWGYFAHEYFDNKRISVENHALGGTSSRTFYRQLWPDVLKGIRKEDYVIIELGHNDNGPYDSGRARASIPGTGKDSLIVTIKETGRVDTVYTYGEYLRRMANDVLSKGAYPILSSLTPRNSWETDGHMTRKTNFKQWAKEIAKELGIAFIDLEEASAQEYEKFSKWKTNYHFYLDKIHTSAFGAKHNAKAMAKAVMQCEESNLKDFLLPKKENNYIVDRLNTKGKTRKAIFFCGDSTMKNFDGGKDAKGNISGMWGWGSVVNEELDKNKYIAKNCGRAGRSIRTFINEGLWERVYNSIEPGDYVVVQFGHNDMGDISENKARADIRGIADSSHVYKIKATGKYEVVYTYGMYLRMVIEDIREKGGIPILASFTPQNEWNKNGIIKRRNDSVALWTRQIAEEQNVMFIDIQNLMADALQKKGMKKAKEYYCNDHTHLSKQGARLCANIFAKWFKKIKQISVNK